MEMNGEDEINICMKDAILVRRMGRQYRQTKPHSAALGLNVQRPK